MAERIYLDNAATSFPKAPGVVEAVSRYMGEVGASPGRGGYAESREGAEGIASARRRIAELVNLDDPGRVVFTLNCSDALNLAIRGAVRQRRLSEPGRAVHLVATAMDHNSVLRPLNELEREGVRWTCVPADAEGIVSAGDVRAAIEDDTLMVCTLHASNVSGSVQPVAEIGRICRERGVMFCLDAAQSLGHLPVDVASLGVDLLAFPGHKGLLGPLGTGGLAIGAGAAGRLATVREGGTGSRSEEDRQPDDCPDRFEAGSHNTPGIVGLGEGVRWILERKVDALRAHERALTAMMLAGLAELDRSGLHLVGPRDPERRVGVFSVWHETVDAHELAILLETSAGVLSRAGIHCAPRAHAALGTLERGGTCRLSVSPFTSEADVGRALDALGAICAHAPASIA